MKTAKHLGTISILIKDRQLHVPEVQKLLTDNSDMIIARLGVNVERKCSSGCIGLITLTVEGSNADINNLTKKIDKLYGIVAKSNILTKN